MALSSNANPLLPLSGTSIPSNYANRNLKSFSDFYNPTFIAKFSAKKPLFICNSRQPFSLRIRAQTSNGSNVNVNEDQISDFIIEDVPHLTNFLPDLPVFLAQ
ncbi:unnamed protein product [Fraxinus pennsylvanica]|uniref:Uncharacterized protein n=1 Tax=Fraxinus pennsylvanica TaxID=56036 RepID=A0AAD2A7T3_9LAMI|nr:unnamed protein product [Fraxinus pennsylvanica]